MRTGTITPAEGRGRSGSPGGPLRRWLPVGLWAGAMFVFSTGSFAGEQTGSMLLPLLRALFPSASETDLQTLHFLVRKLAHFVEYLVLAVLLYRALDPSHPFDHRTARNALALAATYAVVDELHQWFVPTRTASALDCLIDVAGAATGLGVLALRGRRGSVNVRGAPSARVPRRDGGPPP